MRWKEDRGQTAIEVGLVLALAIFVATVAGLVAKSVFTTTQGGVQETTNAVVNQVNNSI